MREREAALLRLGFGCRETFSCLGDVFSINWMRDAANLTQTVGAQIDLVTNETAVPRAHTDPNHISHPQQYGDTTIRADQIGMFEGSPQSQHGKYSLCSSSTRHLLAAFLLLFSPCCPNESPCCLLEYFGFFLGYLEACYDTQPCINCTHSHYRMPGRMTRTVCCSDSSSA